jgi:hypothetical protein
MGRAFIAVVIAVAVVAAVFQMQSSSSAQTTQVSGGKGPVVVELFTSEGCSSCPPADTLLRKLEADGSLNGTEIIPLGWHVDYWDRQGWKDRFSSADFTKRQHQYADAFASDQVYTPQMVVDGRVEFVGSDENKARTAIVQASRLGKAAISLSMKQLANGKVEVITDVRDLPSPIRNSRVWLLVTERNLESDVRAGENNGTVMKHAAVVRSVKPIGSALRGKPYYQTSELQLDRRWKLADLRLVVLLQDERDHGIVGAASIPLQ